jgi:hypothetical protein
VRVFRQERGVKTPWMAAIVVLWPIAGRPQDSVGEDAAKHGFTLMVMCIDKAGHDN